jgi:plastocyanin
MSRQLPLAGLVSVAAAAALAAAMMFGLAQPVTTVQPAANPVSPKTPEPVWTPQFVTGYEPDEVTANGADTITWMVFDNTSTHDDATPWAMSVFYETPGTVNDRWARLIDDPTEPGNTVLAYWLKNAVIDAGYQNHTKGRIQTGFPGDLVDAVEVYGRQRIYLHEDFNLLLDYPPDGDPWWLGVVIGDFWMGAAWEGHPNPSLIGLTFGSYNGAMRLFLHHRTMPDLGMVWAEQNLDYALPIGEWFTMEVGFKTGDADSGRVVIVVTPESTGKATVVFDITNWTYDPAADEPGGTGPVPMTKWNPQKLYSSDNVIHFIRDAGGVAQAYFDDFEFSGQWPPNWP